MLSSSKIILPVIIVLLLCIGAITAFILVSNRNQSDQISEDVTESSTPKSLFNLSNADNISIEVNPNNTTLDVYLLPGQQQQTLSNFGFQLTISEVSEGVDNLPYVPETGTFFTGDDWSVPIASIEKIDSSSFEIDFAAVNQSGNNNIISEKTLVLSIPMSVSTFNSSIETDVSSYYDLAAQKYQFNLN
jgi:hypothetical protein